MVRLQWEEEGGRSGVERAYDEEGVAAAGGCGGEGTEQLQRSA